MQCMNMEESTKMRVGKESFQTGILVTNRFESESYVTSLAGYFFDSGLF